MKQRLLLIGLAALAVAGCAGKQTDTLATKGDTLSWALGENIGISLKQAPVNDLNTEMVIMAIRNILDGKEQRFSDEEYAQLMQSLVGTGAKEETTAQQTAVSPQEVDRLQKEFFDNIGKTHPNAKRHPSGFYYEQIKAGSGPNAVMAQRILFDYKSYLLLTGEPYDQTYGKRDPIMHVVGHPMFPGLIEALQLMNAGSIYRFYFPYQLAFGEKGSGPIPGYTPLIYEVELHELYND